MKDICARKHGGNAESEAAWQGLMNFANSDSEQILERIRAAKAQGLTRKEAAAKMGKELHKISGRFSKLKADKKIVELGVARDSSGVCVAKEYEGEARKALSS